MIDYALIILVILIATTSLTAYEYYHKLKRAHKEYVIARDFIEDIVLSFDRELKHESKKFDNMVLRVESSHNTAESSYRKAEKIARIIEPMQEQLTNLDQSFQVISESISHDLTVRTQNSTTVLSEFSGLEAKLKDLAATQETLKNKIISYEEQIQKLSITPSTDEIKSQISMPPILIKRDKALSALTDTEITVLEMLSKEGAKTAPKIKERVHLSREHTARLMKKLYEEGYLEREAGKIPFQYSIKKEMITLLQKTENSASPTLS
jgi:hypothetical protein